uniref:Uncharacterized protein n=1 Tax=Ananas comosus var. bracteatus TaxID=296719 RepID=A0A6V7NVZ7_ANACO|nr:unnamed protein product [Ananas comosus var. bracteatus]
MSSPTTSNAGAHDRRRHSRLLQWRLRHGGVNQEEGREGEGASGAAGALRRRTVQDSCGARCKEGLCRQSIGFKPRMQGRRPLHAERSTSRHEMTCNQELNLDAMLEKRFLRLKAILLEFPKADSQTQILDSEARAGVEATKGKRTNSRVSWADQKGGSLTSWCPLAGKSSDATAGSCNPSSKEKSPMGTLNTQWKKKASYKEVLLRYAPQPEPSKLPHHSPHFRLPNLVGRCFRCLAKDHKIKDCRDPLLCKLCFRFGHPARFCHYRSADGRGKLQRALHFRPPSMKVFIPLTEGFHSRQELCRNAVLANVIGPANLGHCHQETIANDFANKFGGLFNDFLVARHCEREFVIFLPQWVRPEDLLRREAVRLRHCQLRCYEWNPYTNASRSQLTFKAWVELVKLPFECWSEARVAAIVNGFGRYL